MNSDIVELIEFLPDHLQEEILYKINLKNYYNGLQLISVSDDFVEKYGKKLSFDTILDLMKDTYNNNLDQPWIYYYVYDWLLKHKRKIPSQYHELEKLSFGINDMRSGLSPLMWAIQFHPEFAEMLIQNGADINLKSKVMGDTALVYSVGARNQKLVNLLLELGADPNVQDTAMGFTPLMLAGNHQIEIARSLLDHGADPNIQNRDTGTALMKATWANDIDMVRLLLEYGADPWIKDDEGRTAANLAVLKKLENITLLLIREMTPGVKSKKTSGYIEGGLDNPVVPSRMNDLD